MSFTSSNSGDAKDQPRSGGSGRFLRVGSDDDLGAADTDAWIDAIVGLVKGGQLRKLEIVRVDGAPVRETAFASRLEAAGFAAGYRGVTYRG